MFNKKEIYTTPEEDEQLENIESLFYTAKAFYIRGLIPLEKYRETKKNLLAQLDSLEKQYSC